MPRTQAIAISTAGLMLAALAAPAAASNYKTPVAGAWKIQHRFDYTTGGSATIAKGSKRLTKLTVNVGAANKAESRCGDIKKVSIAKSLPIKRVGSYKRPAVGRIGKDKLITSISTTLKVDGKNKPGTAKVIFEMDGRSAFTAELVTGSCKLYFAIVKKK